MTAAEILKEVRSIGGRIEASGDRLHVDVPAGTLTPELKERLREHKAEILKKLELEASMKCLEATHISIAVLDDGSMCVVQAGNQGAMDGGTIYTPADLYYYVQLAPHERRMLHSFKRRFGGSVDWRVESERK